MPTEMTPLNKFLPLVLPLATGCPNMVAAQNLRLAAIEFCERTSCWREMLTLYLDVGETMAITPDYACIHKIEFAEFNGNRLIPLVYTDIANDETSKEGTPEYLTQVTPQSVCVFPGAQGDLKVSAFLKPVNGTEFIQNPDSLMENYYDQVPLFMYQQHAETIARGALARILDQKNQKYSDPQGAAMYRAMFEERVRNASSHSITGQQRAPLRTKTVWF